MYIETLASTHFRNLSSGSIHLSPGINLILGKNGQGKTNLLEAIYLFKFGRSFRTYRDPDVIRFGEGSCNVEVTCVYQTGDRERFTAVVERDGGKQIKVSGKAISRLSELVGRYPCVLFGPQDMQLVNGFPIERRRYFDMIGSMVDREYLELLKSYRRVLQHRNAAIRRGDLGNERSVWDDELVRRGCGISNKRIALTEAIGSCLKRQCESMGIPFDFRIAYESDFLDESSPGEDPAEVFFLRLSSLAEEESRRGITLTGPHRDDIRFSVGEKDLKRFGSQGQKRVFTVLLKLAELSHMEEELGERCILLMDDVFSELDGRISASLKRNLPLSRQIFAASPVPLDWESADSLRTFRVSGGSVET